MTVRRCVLREGARDDGLPFGVSLIAPALSDAALVTLSERWMGEPVTTLNHASRQVRVAVVGAHLTGQPLNHQLIDRGATLVKACRTASRYRLFALPRTSPPKPALLRVDADAGRGIDVEVWDVPEGRFGSFVAAIPWPLAIGSLELESGEWVSGFVCEPLALQDAEDITTFGGWRAYLASRQAAAREP